MRANLLHALATDYQRGQIRLREVAIIMGLLLATLRNSDATILNPAARLLHNHSTGAQYLNLTHSLVFQSALNRAEAVHVFNLDLRAKSFLSARAYRNVGITAQTTLFHSA